MNSQERREGRYQRRKEKRRKKREGRCAALGSLAEVFSYRKMFFYGRKCCNGVRWKQSAQNFEMHLFSGTARRRREILNGTWKPKKCIHFTLCERGKVRPIDAPHITDRQVHKTLCNEVLIPLYTPSMIHDNGASQIGKGLHWHFDRVKQHLAWHYRRYGREGAVLQIDLKSYFPNAPHNLIYQRHEQLIPSPDLRELADKIIYFSPCTTPGRGMPLGVEPSQQEMVALPSSLDNRIKARLSIHGAAHYMDDYYTILPSKQAAEATAADVIGHAEAMGLQVNAGKSKVVPFSRPFRFCKAKFQVTDTGAVKIHGCRDGMKRARRKLRLFQARVASGEMTVEQVAQWLQTPISYYENFNDHGRVLKLRRLFYAIFKTEV